MNAECTTELRLCKEDLYCRGKDETDKTRGWYWGYYNLDECFSKDVPQTLRRCGRPPFNFSFSAAFL
ncbi:hypothetical protein CEXT_371091 [Caerostris extrusa]|uniref:Uncharacterized protein n=1 Tax=Caerostris extrusa TaxID=172846 RepID=A0AAV4RIJ4_CAEEX|nr:hypothetical protein CEXT_371091 [Caerostris extrusa]